MILAITGASGSILGIRALELMQQASVEVHLVISEQGALTLAHETGKTGEEIASLASACYDPHDMGAAIASGSFHTDGMLVLPCSIKTLSAIANAYTSDLISRAADVCLKEGRPVILGVREAPFHHGHLRLMDLAVQAGAVVYPPIPFFYGHPQSLDDLVTSTVARMLQRLGLETSSYPHWEGL